MPVVKQRRPDPSEYAAPFARYVDRVPETGILAALSRQAAETAKLLASIDDARGGYRYAPDKWSIRQVVGHMEDAERVFAYRALTIGRGDATPLPGFDENHWMESAPFEATTLKQRADNFALVRRTTIALLETFDDAAWDRKGTANDALISVRALAYITAGHERHHVSILRERYLPQARTT